MIEEILIDHFAMYREHFRDPQVDMVLAAIAEGNSRVQLWGACPAGREAVFLWDKANNVFYLSGELAEGQADEWAQWIETDLRPRAIAERRAWFGAWALSKSGEAALPQLFRGAALKKKVKLFYAFRRAQAEARPASAEVQFELIDAAFLEKTQRKNLSSVRAEIEWMWPSLARFGERGFGVAAVGGEAVVCWCTAEYVSRDHCGIGIQTVEAFEKQGIATAAATRFVNHCVARHMTPHWECDSQNLGSIRVAEKVGFEKIQETPVWVGMFQ